MKRLGFIVGYPFRFLIFVWSIVWELLKGFSEGIIGGAGCAVTEADIFAVAMVVGVLVMTAVLVLLRGIL